MSVCKACEEPLMLEVEAEDGSEETQQVPDDLELPCRCHFHWQCFLDESPEVAMSLKCPSCGSQLAANTAGPSVTNQFLPANVGVKILTRYVNEGGVQEDLDILPSVTEEAYLAANPAAAPARAYHVMCGEGDVGGIVELLRDADQSASDEDGLTAAQLMRYQDPLNGNQSGLHIAVQKGQDEVVWALLWLASSLSSHTIPELVSQSAQAMGLERPQVTHSEDIRSLQDSQGRTAEDIAAQMGGVWTTLVESGVLHPGTQ
ncbi:hypothetical protein Micbo1qcDRAFT_234322 [Microdochium bolleyi]|uniref:Uncharacterized protein n=1 Tax=Microdochium bolleyi TaxID=196109 RepID=A0A136J1S4_9PEZI|nr:hypothetical protein Micbo1qcDRAFT_234322 [Microdochium bolleyi]